MKELRINLDDNFNITMALEEANLNLFMTGSEGSLISIFKKLTKEDDKVFPNSLWLINYRPDKKEDTNIIFRLDVPTHNKRQIYKIGKEVFIFKNSQYSYSEIRGEKEQLTTLFKTTFPDVDVPVQENYTGVDSILRPFRLSQNLFEMDFRSPQKLEEYFYFLENPEKFVIDSYKIKDNIPAFGKNIKITDEILLYYKNRRFYVNGNDLEYDDIRSIFNMYDTKKLDKHTILLYWYLIATIESTELTYINSDNKLNEIVTPFQDYLNYSQTVNYNRYTTVYDDSIIKIEKIYKKYGIVEEELYIDALEEIKKNNHLMALQNSGLHRILKISLIK